MNNSFFIDYPEAIEKPAPKIFERPPKAIFPYSNNRKVFDAIKRGDEFCFEGTYGTAMAFYSWIKKKVNQLYPIFDFQSSRTNREMLYSLSSVVYVRIKNHLVNLDKAPSIPWLKEFYPNSTEFYLRFVDVLGMNGAWQWYKNGIFYPNLSYKLHPFYGVYFPTRTEHVVLFDSWLSKNTPILSAVDMGAGCGVLTHYLIKHGAKTILSTDVNPNALFSLQQDLVRQNLQNIVEFKLANLFDNIDTRAYEAVIFNPPWIPDTSVKFFDKAVYYQSNFFETFFNQASKALSTGSKLVLLFSTFAQVAGITTAHPIDYELVTNQRFGLVSRIEKPVNQKPSKRKSWLSQIRQSEKIELWELVKN